MDAKEIKEYIIKHDKLKDLLHKIGCHSFASYSKELRCALPQDDDNSKVSVFDNEEISVRIFTKGETIYGDIYNLIMHIYSISFKEAYKKCALFLGLSATGMSKPTTKTDHLDLFKKIKNKKKHHYDEYEQKYYDLSILNVYSNIPHVELIKKDAIIDRDVLTKYYILFDEKSDRIIFPHFKYDDKTKIAGIIGRTVNPAYEQLKIPKYFSMEGIKYEKSKNLYGLSHNIENIKEFGYIIVFESEKSVIKADMFGYPVGVAVGSHEISNHQKKILLSLNVEIIIAFDKDVKDEHVINICTELNKYRMTSYIKDKWALLKGKKDAPVDRGKRRFEYLLRNRIYSEEVM